jgi:hypothetical protein
MGILQEPVIWAVSVPLIVLYVLTAFFLFLVLTANQRAVEAPKGGKPLAPTAVAALAFASNFLAIATVAILARSAGYPARMSIVLLPIGLVLDHYGRTIYRDRRNWASPAAGLVGAVCGMIAGALMTIHGVAHDFNASRFVAPADVQTLPLADILRRGDDWAISIQLIVCYLVAVALFFALHQFLVRAGKSLLSPTRGGKGKANFLPLAAAALIANFAATAVVVFIANSVGVAPRLAMILVPMFLISESYTKALVNDRPGRHSYLVGVLSSAAGMIIAMVVLMRDARFQ